MFWSIDQDDFRGYCRYRYPLIRAGKFTFVTGILVNNVDMLEKAEESVARVQSWGYEYPKPTIRQPEFNFHEFSTTPFYQVPTTMTTAHEIPSNFYEVSNRPTFNNPSTTNAHTTFSTTRFTTVRTTTAVPTTTKPHKNYTTKPTTTTVVPEMTKMPTTITIATTKPLRMTTQYTPTTSTTSVPPTTGKPLTIPHLMTTSPSTPKIPSNKNNGMPFGDSTPFYTTNTPISFAEEDKEYSDKNLPKVPPSDLIAPVEPSYENNETDSSLNNAIFQLNRVLSTVNQVITNINSLNSASRVRNPSRSNTTIDPSIFQILQPLYNLRNSAQFTVENPDDRKPTNTTVQIDSNVKKFVGDNLALPSDILSRPSLADIINITKRDPNSTEPLSLLTKKGLFISGRDIVTINLNISVNNNYYGGNG